MALKFMYPFLFFNLSSIKFPPGITITGCPHEPQIRGGKGLRKIDVGLDIRQKKEHKPQEAEMYLNFYTVGASRTTILGSNFGSVTYT